MRIVDLLGRCHSLLVVEETPHGLLLEVPAAAHAASGLTLLLPGNEIPKGTRVGDSLEVFVYRDSEDRPIATIHPPKLQLGEVAFLSVSDITPIGAFAAWGPGKELLIPFAEQTCELFPGEAHPFGLLLDRRNRLCGTMRVRELLTDPDCVQVGDWLDGEAYRNEPELGLFVILKRRFLGLVPAGEPHGLQRGQAASFRVTQISSQGKLALSLRKPIAQQLDVDAELVLAKLSGRNPPRVGDDSSPEEIRRLFGLSKKAFKRAVGRLLKQGVVRSNVGTFEVVLPTS
jgi:predicted RNA-binding protein (virulence factor B family)